MRCIATSWVVPTATMTGMPASVTSLGPRHVPACSALDSLEVLHVVVKPLQFASYMPTYNMSPITWRLTVSAVHALSPVVQQL